MREFRLLVVPLMIGNVLVPRLLPWEVKAASTKIKESRAALENGPAAMVSELLHKAAYCNDTLGLSSLASAWLDHHQLIKNPRRRIWKNFRESDVNLC